MPLSTPSAAATTHMKGASGQTLEVAAGASASFTLDVTDAATALVVFSITAGSAANLSAVSIKIGGATGGSLLGEVAQFITDTLKTKLVGGQNGLYYDDRVGYRSVQFTFTALAAGGITVTYDWETRR